MYLEVELPERFALDFRTESGEWVTEAICLADQFERLDDGSYVCSEYSSGLWIRCIANHADHFEHIDGSGRIHRYRLIAPIRRTS